jgi:ubiquinol-cytochrome c reductase cytochrome b subunit
MNALAAFLLRLNANNAEALRTAPDFAVEGAMVYQGQHCGTCHQLNGTGGKMGPILNGLAGHRTKEWVVGHFAEPKKFSPGSIMPPYRFSPRDLDRITEYLMSVPAPEPASD